MTSGASEVMVRRARRIDCAAAAALHERELPGEFLSSLGARFLTVLYEGINAHPDGFVLVAEEAGVVVGFVSGATNTARVTGTVMRRRAARLAFWAGLRMIRHPWLLRHVFAAIGRRAGDHDAEAELLSIAVAGVAQGRGGGSALFTAFLREMGNRRVPFFHLIVDERNARARAFYARHGMQMIERVRMFGTWKCRLGLRLG